jgi:hypothetical protein
MHELGCPGDSIVAAAAHSHELGTPMGDESLDRESSTMQQDTRDRAAQAIALRDLIADL